LKVATLRPFIQQPQRKKKLDVVESDLRKINAQFAKDTKFRDFLVNPLIKIKTKQDIMKQALQSKLGIDDLTIKLLNVMTETGRLKLLPGVANSFCKVMEVSRGEVECTVISAKPLTDEAMKKEIEAALKGFTKNKLKIQHRVDESLVGGLVIDFGGEHYIDMSIRSKMKMYSELIQQAV